MVQTRHSSKDTPPQEDSKYESIRVSSRRNKEPANDLSQHSLGQSKKRESTRGKESSYHLFNGDLEENRKRLRSSDHDISGHNLRFTKESRRYSKDSPPYPLKKKKSNYIKTKKFSPHADATEEDHNERRRSGRLRRELYGSLNEKMICYDPHYKKDKAGGEEDSDDEREQEKSMYDFVKKHRRQESVTPQKHGKSGRHRQGKYESDNSDDSEEEEEEEDEEEGDEEMEEQEEQDESQNAASYSLRKTKPITKRYTAPPISGTRKRRVSALYAIPHSPMHKAAHRRIPQHSSPHHRSRKRVFGERRKHYGSSTSSSSGDSDDEVRFEKRKRKSMALARSRCLPMNFAANDVIGLIKDRERARGRGNVGSSLADIEPMSVDSKVTFESIGGLDRHIRALKEMVVFPLMYPEVFEKFKISPPRGVLFHGPPGTGKTLVARALANECGLGGHKVAFFMRKGADCLSKWVGESERQLRLLFDQAYAMRPSIIFFDEIDGLAPVRSTRQDQIHSSIVSTLLALMDGLDSRGEIVVIGATNRIDSIDPALRRPGRFDREFLFTLPNSKARRQIFEIHTKDWQPKLSKAFQLELADHSVGYCGADIKALCTEAALFALRRRYPQIYGTNVKLVIDVENVRVSAKDFRNAMSTITPASQRAVVSPGRALEISVKPLLLAALEEALSMLRNLFPPATLKDLRKDTEGTTSTRGASTSASNVLDDDDCSSDDDEHQMNIYEPAGIGRSTRRIQRLSSPPPAPPEHGFLNVFTKPRARVVPHRPRYILAGNEGMGQSTHLAPALLYAMEHLTVHVMDLPALFGVSARVPEEACAQIFREARRTAPCVIYLPHVGTWWHSISETTRATFVTLLDDLPPSAAILLMCTSNTQFEDLPERVQDMFCKSASEVYEVHPPKKLEREEYFKTLLLVHTLESRQTTTKKKNQRVLEMLPVAPSPQVRQLNDAEVAELRKQEENTLRELRLFLRQISWKLLADRKFKEFSKPVDLEEVPDYLNVIKNPMDLSTIMTRINSHYYQNCAQYLEDIDLITNNCLEYNPDRDQFDRLLRNRACELRDTAYAMVEADLDPEFEKMCIEIVKSREERGETRGFNAPSYVRCLQKNPNPLRAVSSAATTSAAQSKDVANNESETNVEILDASQDNSTCTPIMSAKDNDGPGTRSSRRLKGITVPDPPYCEVPVERNLIKGKVTKEKLNDTVSELTSGLGKVDEALDEKAAASPLQSTDLADATDVFNSEENIENEETEENCEVQELREDEAEATDKIDSQRHKEVIEEEEQGVGQDTPTRSLRLTLEDSLVNDSESSFLECNKNEETKVLDEKTETVEREEAEEIDDKREESYTFDVENVDELNMADCQSPSIVSQHPEESGVPQADDTKDKMEHALKYLVEKTEGFSVTALEKIYSSISKLIYRHQRQENRYSLISEIINFIDRL